MDEENLKLMPIDDVIELFTYGCIRPCIECPCYGMKECEDQLYSEWYYLMEYKKMINKNKKADLEPVVENRFLYKGYPCVVIFQTMFHRCGYVGIPKGHKYYGKEYDEINDIECHGGLTYSRNDLFGQDDEDTWWIGFDCSHYRDGEDYETAKKYWKDNPYVLEKISIHKHLDEGFGREEYEARTLGYVEDECQHIVDQIIEKNMENNITLNPCTTPNGSHTTNCTITNTTDDYFSTGYSFTTKEENVTTVQNIMEVYQAVAIEHYIEGNCDNCYETVYDHQKYCHNCGYKLEWYR